MPEVAQTRNGVVPCEKDPHTERTVIVTTKVVLETQSVMHPDIDTGILKVIVNSVGVFKLPHFMDFCN